MVVHKAPVVRIVLIPSSQGRQAWTVNSDGRGVEMELMEDGTTRFLRPLWSSSSRSRLASDGEEERPKLQTISGYARISGEEGPHSGRGDQAAHPASPAAPSPDCPGRPEISDDDHYHHIEFYCQSAGSL